MKTWENWNHEGYMRLAGDFERELCNVFFSRVERRRVKLNYIRVFILRFTRALRFVIFQLLYYLHVNDDLALMKRIRILEY